MPITTYLELTDPGGASGPARGSADVRRVEPPDGARQPALLPERRRAPRVDGPPRQGRGAGGRRTPRGRDLGARSPSAGYYELHAVGDDVEIAYFGLLPAFQGRGLGGALLEHALRRGFELGVARVGPHVHARRSLCAG